MGFLKNIPTNKKAKFAGDSVMSLSHELKSIIVAQNCVDFKTINLGGLEYALFMYDLECYRQVMTLKYSNFYIESIIRTIFLTMESNMRMSGNKISDGYLLNIFTKLSNAIHNAFSIAKNDGVDGFYGVAEYLLLDECGMSEEEIDANMDLVVKIVGHFNKIVNLPLDKI